MISAPDRAHPNNEISRAKVGIRLPPPIGSKVLTPAKVLNDTSHPGYPEISWTSSPSHGESFKTKFDKISESQKTSDKISESRKTFDTFSESRKTFGTPARLRPQTRARRHARSKYDWNPPGGLVVHVPTKKRRGTREIRQPDGTKQVSQLVDSSLKCLQRTGAIRRPNPANVPSSCPTEQRLNFDWKATEDLRKATAEANRHRRNERHAHNWDTPIPRKPKSSYTNNPRSLITWLENSCANRN